MCRIISVSLSLEYILNLLLKTNLLSYNSESYRSKDLNQFNTRQHIYFNDILINERSIISSSRYSKTKESGVICILSKSFFKIERMSGHIYMIVPMIFQRDSTSIFIFEKKKIFFLKAILICIQFFVLFDEFRVFARSTSPSHHPSPELRQYLFIKNNI